MNRITMLSRDDLEDDRARSIWDSIAAVRPRMQGPYNLLMNVPSVAEVVVAVDDHFRTQSDLSYADREFAILVAGRRLRCRHLWVRHVDPALEAGLTVEEIDALRNQDVSGMSPRRQAIAALVEHIVVNGGHMDDEEFARLSKVLSRNDILQFATMAGFYVLLGGLLNLFLVGAEMDEAGFE